MGIPKARKLTAEKLPKCSLSNKLESEVKTMMMDSGALGCKFWLGCHCLSKENAVHQDEVKEVQATFSLIAAV